MKAFNRMRSPLCAFSTAFAIGLACSHETQAGDEHRKHGHTIPFSMDASATSFTTPEFVDDHMLMNVFGVGQGNVVGAITFEAPHDFNLVDGTYVSDAFVSTACGDILHIVTVGQFINAVDSVGTWTIEGGTGRFENATGAGTVLNLNFGADIHFEGTLAEIKGRHRGRGHND